MNTWKSEVILLTPDTCELWPAAKLNFWWAISVQQPQLCIQRQMRGDWGNASSRQEASELPSVTGQLVSSAAPQRQKAQTHSWLHFCTVLRGLTDFDASAKYESKSFPNKCENVLKFISSTVSRSKKKKKAPSITHTAADYPLHHCFHSYFGAWLQPLEWLRIR